MNAPTGTTLAQRTEWLLGIGEPKPPSRFGLAFIAFIATLAIGALLWSTLSGGREEGVGYPTTAFSFLWLWLIADTGGSFLYDRRGVWWGRGLRTIGYAVFLPLSMGFYLLIFWSISTLLFVGLFALVVVWAVRVAFRLAHLAWRSE